MFASNIDNVLCSFEDFWYLTSYEFCLTGCQVFCFDRFDEMIFFPNGIYQTYLPITYLQMKFNIIIYYSTYVKLKVISRQSLIHSYGTQLFRADNTLFYTN